jgi:2-amino-4-hydroxy-6-hydroxymethyldihydropteridine diphosphokinase
MNKAVILLGSNINPKDNLREALSILADRSEIIAKSRIYKTRAVGSQGPDFLNQAVMVQTRYAVSDIKLNLINPIETTLKRVRSDDKYAPRTIDLDVIIFNDEIVDHNLWKYRFIAKPVSDLLPDLLHPERHMTLREITCELK